MKITEIETFYTINRRGDIWSRRTEKLMYQQVCRNGYHRVWLTVNKARKTYLVHRLVAAKYVDGWTKEKCDVNHMDLDKSNNWYKNLEWVTKSENRKHAWDSGKQYPFWKHSKNYKKDDNLSYQERSEVSNEKV